jgi:hypothetical protein
MAVEFWTIFFCHVLSWANQIRSLAVCSFARSSISSPPPPRLCALPVFCRVGCYSRHHLFEFLLKVKASPIVSHILSYVVFRSTMKCTGVSNGEFLYCFVAKIFSGPCIREAAVVLGTEDGSTKDEINICNTLVQHTVQKGCNLTLWRQLIYSAYLTENIVGCMWKWRLIARAVPST